MPQLSALDASTETAPNRRPAGSASSPPCTSSAAGQRARSRSSAAPDTSTPVSLKPASASGTKVAAAAAPHVERRRPLEPVAADRLEDVPHERDGRLPKVAAGAVLRVPAGGDVGHCHQAMIADRQEGRRTGRQPPLARGRVDPLRVLVPGGDGPVGEHADAELAGEAGMLPGEAVAHGTRLGPRVVGSRDRLRELDDELEALPGLSAGPDPLDPAHVRRVYLGNL